MDSLQRLLVEADLAFRRRDFEQAIQRYRAALALSPRDPLIWANLTHIHWLADDAEQGLISFEEARSQLSDSDLPWRNLGNLQRDRNDFEAAESACRRAMELEDSTEQAETAWNRSQVLIGLERYGEAFSLAERRFQILRHQVWRPGPYWQGWPAIAADHPAEAGEASRLDGLPVCVWSEQGLGDTLQYLRWLPELIRRGARVRLELEPSLVSLVRQGLAWVGDGLTVAPKGWSPRPLSFPCQGSLLSLPMLLGGAPLPEVFELRGEAPDQLRGYLRSPLWQGPPAIGVTPRPRVGLVWASGRKHDDDFVIRDYQRRSLPAEPLRALLQGLHAAGAELINLQFGPDVARADGWGGSFKACLPPSACFAEAARWIAGLDLVISVDTATAHQVGAMGASGWLLLPWNADPRWLRNRSDSPWYPSLTLLRQSSPGDWWDLVDQVLNRFSRWQVRRHAP